MKIYQSKYDKLYIGMYIFITLILLGICIFGFFDEKTGREEWLLVFGLMFLLCVVLWLGFLLIKIKITNKFMIINMGYDVMKLDINDINKIRIGETMWAGFYKYGTSQKGLIVFSKSRNDIYITPKNQEEFLTNLKEINPHIVIDDVRKKHN